MPTLVARPALPVCLLATAVLLACATPQRPIFEIAGDAPVWPPPPAAPRIRYVGELKSSQDLHPPRGWFQRLADRLFGEPDEGRLAGPRATLVSPDGSVVWVADPGCRCLHRFGLADRGYVRVEEVDGTRLLTPVGLALGPEGSFYVCDSEAGEIYRLALDDGRPLGSLSLPNDLERPVACAFDATEQRLYVADVSRHVVFVLAPDGQELARIGRRGEAPGEFNFPLDVLLDGPRLWVVDAGNHRVQALDRQGRPLVTIGRPGDAPGDLALPKSIAMDSAGHLYVVDARFENIQIFDRQGRLLLFLGEEGTGPGEFWLPGGVSIDAQDRIWVADTYNGRIQVFLYLPREENDDA